ncbi:TPA: hypothetical protein ACH3X3_008001 [Trebouxia sp. C0006]
MLTETQSPALFGRQLRGYSMFTIPATSLGRAGVCYIPPDSHHSVQLSQRSAQVRFESLAAHIAQLNLEGHVLLAGDLNARVGAASQPWITELGEGISAQLQNSDITVNVQSSRVGAHRHESDHFPLELQLLLTVPTLPTAPPPPPAPTPTWVWDSSQRGPYAHALLSGPCQALIAGCTAAASAHQHSLSATGSAHLELADAQFCSAIDTAAQAASLRRKQPGTGRQPPHLSCYP